jgi:hypothetical protein
MLYFYEKYIQNVTQNPKEKRLLARRKRKYEDTIITDLKEIEWKVVYWMIELALDRVQLWALVNTVMKQVSEREGNFLTS